MFYRNFAIILKNKNNKANKDMKRNLETICIHGGWQPKKGEPQQLPIYLVCSNRVCAITEPLTKHISDFFTAMKFGYLIEAMGYFNFYWLCFALGIPGMLLLFKVAPWNGEKVSN